MTDNSFKETNIKFIDLFCGMGGFHLGINQACQEQKKEATCVFSSDIDKFARKTYKSNFNIEPSGDITKIDVTDIPEHDILCGGFPCQSFSSIGKREGFKMIQKELYSLTYVEY